MSAKQKYEAALERANAKDAARAARAQARAHKIADESTLSANPIPVQPEQRQTASSAVEDSKAAAEESQRRTCLCHKDQNRPMDSHGCCKAQIDSIRFGSRVAADTDLDDVARVQALIDSGVIKRAKTKGELAAQRESRGTASALKEVANANGKPVVLTPKPDLPDGVDFFDSNQAHHFAKCAVLRGLNFQLAAKDAYPLLSPFEHGVVAAAAEKDPNIRAAIEQEASQRGLGDSDKQIYVSLLWKHALSQRPQDYQDRGTAMRILGRVFLPENGAVQQQPTKLVIEGFDEGIKKLFGDDLPTVQGVAAGAIPNLTDADFDAEDAE
jgi:hypothetical protein